jgi:phosphatidylinositol 4-kinase A
MIIHLEAEWDDAILERFALVIAQQSLHFALQLNWILQGAIEDYQPELPDGSMNPNFQPLYYTRCTKLLTNIERCVVYRRPRSAELQALYEKGKITKTELHLMEHADRRFNALQITGGDENEVGEKFGGTLLYKRTVRTACYKPKPWKTRYCIIEDRMLNCFNSKGGRMVRSMPLEGATIEPDPNSKYYFTFVISNRSFEWRMRAANQEDHDRWIKALTEESNTTAVFGHLDSSLHKSSEDRERVVSEMTEAQRARYDFFRDERDFVRRVTDIAEELRFKEPHERKQLAPQLMKSMNIAPCVYSPLCNSTNIWRRVTGTFYADTRVFNTKERCPVIMNFLTARGEQPDRRSGKRNANLDVAEFIQQKFDGFEEENNITSTITEEDEKPFDERSREEDDDPEKVVQDMYGEAANGAEGDSSVWHDSILKGQQQTQGGNRALQRFLRESFVSIPRKLAKGLEGRRPSILANATGLQSVPIVEGDQGNIGEDGHKSLGDVSVGRSSVFGKQGVVLGDLDEGDIDMDSIRRAKQLVSGGESWAEKSLRMLEEAKKKPADAELEVVSLMSKSNDDLRQEVFVMQMIHYYKSVFAKAKLPIWLKTYRILSTSSTTGLIEVLVDATSIDGLKKSDGYPKEGGMRKYFEETYGPPTSKSFLAAQQNFMQSLVGYSLVSYLLGLKDRHNGNIMIDTRAHLIQIDFGFAMGMAPGHEFSMERAPFKFTQEYLDVMGGPGSECFAEFKRLFVAGFKEARKNSQIALGLVEIMMYKSKYPCFSGSRYGNGISLKRFEKRLMLDVPDKHIENRALGLLHNANNHRGTRMYDSFQQYSNGYAI